MGPRRKHPGVLSDRGKALHRCMFRRSSNGYACRCGNRDHGYQPAVLRDELGTLETFLTSSASMAMLNLILRDPARAAAVIASTRRPIITGP